MLPSRPVLPFLVRAMSVSLPLARARLALYLAGFWVVGCGASPGHLKVGELTHVTPELLLDEMNKRYLSCRSYEDTGIVSIETHTEGRARPRSYYDTFNTLFDRASGYFRFEYTAASGLQPPLHRGAIWRQRPGPAQIWRWLDSRIQNEDLPSAIEDFSAISKETSRDVPAMLLGLPNGITPGRSEFRIEGTETIGGFLCTKLSARLDDDVIVVWIGTEDHVLRRVFTRDHLQANAEDMRFVVGLLPPGVSDADRREFAAQRSRSFVYDKTIEYSPVFDRPIDPSRFEFMPPPSPPASLP